MSIKALIEKLFVGGTWFVGFRPINEINKPFTVVPVPDKQWIADPFLYEVSGKHYLFVEQYFVEKQRAGIGVFEFINGIPTNNHLIIENNYHMSYPCVFSYKGKHYIIPESSANKTIDLYVADVFPYKWSHKATLLEGEKYVDSTVYMENDNCYLLSYKREKKGWLLVLFSLDIESLCLTKISEKFYNSNIGRPAGFIYSSDLLFRPSQDCRKKYGEGIIINAVDNIGNNGFDEHFYSLISHTDIKSSVHFNRVHTINRDSSFEVVDMFREKIDLLHAIRILRRSIK